MQTTARKTKVEVMAPLWYRKLEKALAHKHMKAYSLAMMLDIAPSRFTLWKQDKGRPTIEQALAICDALNIPSLRWLVDDRIGIDDEELPALSSDAERVILNACRKLGTEVAMSRILDSLQESPRHHAPIRSADLTRRDREQGHGDGSAN